MSYRIPFNRPTCVPAASAAIATALESGRLSGNGPFTRRCEERLVALTGARQALLTSSCTAALELSALLLNAEAGDEVIVPSFTFVSTANAFATHGLRPVFADCRRDTFNIDERHVERLITRRTRALVVVHYGGVACEMDALVDLAGRHGLRLIEDNAHGLLGRYKGRALGTFGALATQSFHETKNITCGEGGALLINDDALIERAEIAREKGTDRSRFFSGQVDKYTWVSLGSNYLCSELQAAMLSAQLASPDDVQAKRQAVWAKYNSDLRQWATVTNVRLPIVPDHAEHPFHLFYLLLPTAAARTRLIEHLAARGILAVFHYLPLHQSPMGRRFGGATGDCPVAEDISARLLRLPFYTDMTADEQAEVIDTVTSFVP
jgi:dTDP-4-amino-4,6-dideoxygalactose transaminase